jgi:ABC-type glycerol-3-phosphate transport system permease component
VNGFFPAVWILFTSLKTETELLQVPITYLPLAPTLDNYVLAFTAQPILRFMWNSVVVAGLSTALCVFVSALAAYALTRLRIPHRNLIMSLLLAVAMFPLISLMVPLFKVMRELGLLNTYLALILPYTVLSMPICTLVMASFFQDIPPDLEAAAMIDGCSRVGALFKVVVPLSAPGVFTAAILSFVNAWDEFLLALTMMNRVSMRTLSVGITLYAPSLVLSTIFGWSEGLTIVLMASATILYVVWGGNRSVIWTDVAQMALVWFGVFTCVFVAITQLPASVSLRDALALAQASGRLEMMDTATDPTRPYTLWSGLIGGMFLAMAYFGCDQSQVQRYLSGRSLTESRLSLLFTGFLKVPMQFLILLTGVLVFAFYNFATPPILWNRTEQGRLEELVKPAEMADLKERFAQAHDDRKEAALRWLRTRSDDDAVAYRAHTLFMESARGEAISRLEKGRARPYVDVNYVFPHYIVTELPRGICGLIIAVIFAAAMSALSGELSSLATSSMVDFYKRYLKADGSEAHDLLMARVFTGLWGIFAGFVALRAGQLGSAIEVVNRFGSLFYGSILGVFMLAVLAPRVRGPAASWALGFGMAAVSAVAFLTPVHFLWWNVVGAATVFGSGLALTGLEGTRR